MLQLKVQDRTIVYCFTSLGGKMCEMLTSAVVLLHENAHLHTAVPTRAPLKHFNWELFDQPPYSPDLTPSYYHLFIHTYLKKCLR
jgi:hypothetical protein